MNILGYFGTIDYGGIETVDMFHSLDRFYRSVETNYPLKEYSIRNSPRPELLSHQLYGTTEYYWVLLMVNEIYDPFYDWIMSDDAVHEYAKLKYQYVGGVNQVAYHVNDVGEKFWNVKEDPAHPNMWYDKRDVLKKHLQYNGPMVPITNIEHELQENEKKRVIKIVPKAQIKRFVSDIRRQMENSRVRSN